MNRADVRELHYITHIDNVASILRHGILSHRLAASVGHVSVADPKILGRRDNKTVPGARKLFDYANLYLNPRNAMMSKIREQHPQLLVLRLKSDVLDLPGAVLTDGNAAGDYVRFMPSPDGLGLLDASLVYTRDWRDPNQIQYFKKKTAACAELLVPERVAASFLAGAYVSCAAVADCLKLVCPGHGLDIVADPDMFFQ